MHRSRFFVPLFCAALTALTAGGGCALAQPSDDYISRTGFFLDTVVTLKLYDTDDESLLDECFALTAEYEELLSRTREGSDVWNINHSAGVPVEISQETADLLATALDYCELSGGKFDISVAPVVSLWNFTSQERAGEIPEDAALADALPHVDYRNITLDGTTVTIADPDASIDLGGIAKGYIADCLKDYLTGQGVASGLIDLGGNMLTIGTKPDGSQWNIGIRKPFSQTGELITAVRCTDQSIVTSGTYERYFEKDGEIYHHILDPSTGYPIQNGLTSVTILSDRSMDGDALSTTCFTLGLTDGLALAESLDGIEAMFVTEDFQMHCTSGWPQ